MPATPIQLIIDLDRQPASLSSGSPPRSTRIRFDSYAMYIVNTYMKRKLVQAGGSLAVTLPAEVVQEFKLRKGMSVDVSVHPQTGAVTIRPGARYFERGKVTQRFEKLANELMDRRSKVYRVLAR